MKEIEELNLPDDLRYATDHEWTKLEGGKVKIGIDDYAQDQLGDIVFVELPEVGATLSKGEEFGTVESVKAVSELFMPIGGEILAINAALEDTPEHVNNNPYNEGWMIEVKPSDVAELDALMDRDAYIKTLKG
ncbi:MAG: glycine cleavage system protein GcvH [Desulfobacterales bacterium]|nr:glycine cleavage system protein GcvH [Deltaproteobacteria bacterium]NNL41759.1 glycine cleavage system protein GcvH [Desulfobacterales bacterium]NNL78113.1 glycine cleavage system protein GcvH [Desulfobacterales bacterium]